MIKHEGVTIIGYTDFASRLPTMSSTLYSNNVTKFLLSIGDKSRFNVNMEDEVVLGSIVLDKGKLVWPPPKPVGPPPPPPKKPVEAAAKTAVVALTPFQKRTRTVANVTASMVAAVGVGYLAGPVYMTQATIFTLASLIGYRVIWGVQPALHSPLMAVTNAISGLVGVGGLFVMGGGFFPHSFPQALAAFAVLISMVNVFGGFVVSGRILDMFRRPTDPPEYMYLYGIPAVVFSAGFLAAAWSGASGAIQAGYLVSSILCINSLQGLASQETARAGNVLGVLGVGTGLLSAFVAAGFPPAVLAQVGAVTAIGGGVGAYVGTKITPTDLPQTVAALHSFVGLAATLTSVASYLAHPGDGMHQVMAYLGAMIGGVTFTGSLVAFGKLHGVMKSAPVVLPGRNYVNAGMVVANLGAMALYLSTGSHAVGITMMLVNTALSFAKGWIITN
ncbi:hypothetical protein HDU93_004882, partial [Gonapodya sp. JEL0774]